MTLDMTGSRTFHRQVFTGNWFHCCCIVHARSYMV